MGLWSSKPTPPQNVNWLEAPHFVNSNNMRIFCKYWEPSVNPRALVYIAHGFAEHCACYDHFGKEFSAEGILVFSHDHVGHGLSEGYRAHVDSFSEYTQDVVQHVQKMKEKYPELPYFILGHSMGGLIAVKVVLDYPDLFNGMLLIAPGLKMSPESLSPLKVKLAKMTAFISPKLEVEQIEAKWQCHDQEVLKRYEEDPLMYQGGARARWCVCFMDTMAECENKFTDLKLPIYNVHGSGDMVCDLTGSKELHEKAASTDKTLQIVEGGYHEIHNEPEGVGEKYRKEMLDWVLNHI